MSEVTVIGLGNMGSALARALLDAPQGRAVTVWNRSPEKAAPLVDKGAILAPSAAEAMQASPVILVCVTNYAAANQILGEAATYLSGKRLVQEHGHRQLVGRRPRVDHPRDRWMWG